MRRNYSRRTQVEEKKNIKKASSLIIVTIIFLTIIGLFGIPLLIRFTGLLTDVRKSSSPIASDDTTPPPMPYLNPLPTSTKNETVDVNGSTESGATVAIVVNGNSHEVLANKSGRFSLSINLKEGENTIEASASDLSGNESSKTEKISIVFDKVPPMVEIISPQDGSEFFGASKKQVSIQGKTEPVAKVTINERYVIVKADGQFSFTTTLFEGTNEFTIKSEDSAGNTTEIKITLKFSP